MVLPSFLRNRPPPQLGEFWLISSGQSPATRWSAAGLPLPHHLRRPALVLVEIERLLSDRLAQLQSVESRLARAAAYRRSQAGRRAVRQVERDRRRVARELHTGVGQSLAAVRMQLGLIERLLPEPPAGVRPALDRIDRLTADALDQIRSISRRLHPPSWQAFPLHQALHQLWEHSGIPQQYIAVFDAPPLPRDPEPDIKTLIYRAAQEALANIMRHAQATRVTLALTGDLDRVVLKVEDDGVGVGPRPVGPLSGSGGGLGLRSIREHAADLGGRLVLRGSPEGAVFEIAAPLEW